MLHGKWGRAATRQTSSEGRNAETARLQADGRWLFVIDDPSVPWNGARIS
jgi:hypothetical protein